VSDIIGAPNHGPLFEPAFRVNPSLAMPGHGTEARARAREKVAPHLRSLRGKVYRILLAHGPLTREQVHGIAPELKQGTINARVAELLGMKRVRILRIDEASGQGLVEALTDEQHAALTEEP
jgi:hypothetical protein